MTHFSLPANNSRRGGACLCGEKKEKHTAVCSPGLLRTPIKLNFTDCIPGIFEVPTFSHIKVQDVFHSTLTDKYYWSLSFCILASCGSSCLCESFLPRNPTFCVGPHLSLTFCTFSPNQVPGPTIFTTSHVFLFFWPAHLAVNLFVPCFFFFFVGT